MEPWNPDNVDPSLLTKKEYLDLVNPDGKGHSSDAYDRGNGFPEWDGHKDDFKLFRRTRIRGIDFEFRINLHKNTYVKRDSEGEMMRDSSGMAIMMTDDEIADKQLPPHDYIITVWTPQEGDKCIAATQDEWGCMLVRVLPQYRRFGIGTLLIKLARTLEPGKTSGGFTGMGYRNFIRAHREFVRDALTSGKYSRMVRAGEITMDRVREIINSVDLTVRHKPTGVNLNSDNPKDWLLFADGHGAFIVYDRKLKEALNEEVDPHFTTRMVKAYLYVMVHPDYARVKRVEGDPKLKTFLFAAAHTMAKEEGATLYVEPSDVDIKGFKLGETSYDAGYKAQPVIDGPTLEWESLARAEAQWRKTFDRYDEFKHMLYEIAEQI